MSGEQKKGDVTVGIVGVKGLPDGSKDFSRALNYIETDKDREDKNRRLSESLKIPGNIKSGTPDMVYFRLRNARLQAKDDQARQGFDRTMQLFSTVKDRLTTSLLKQSINGGEGSMTRDEIRRKIDNLSTEEFYDLLQKEIDSCQRDLESSSEDGPSTDFFSKRIKMAEDLQQRLLAEGLNTGK